MKGEEEDPTEDIFIRIRKHNPNNIYKKEEVNKRDKKFRTPLMIAVYLGNLDLTQKLLNLGADVSLKDEDSKTVLMWAASRANQNDEIIKIICLHSSKNDIDNKDKDGNTALNFAISKKNTFIEEIKVLMENGADIFKTDFEKVYKDFAIKFLVKQKKGEEVTDEENKLYKLLLCFMIGKPYEKFLKALNLFYDKNLNEYIDEYRYILSDYHSYFTPSGDENNIDSYFKDKVDDKSKIYFNLFEILTHYNCYKTISLLKLKHLDIVKTLINKNLKFYLYYSKKDKEYKKIFLNLFIDHINGKNITDKKIIEKLNKIKKDRNELFNKIMYNIINKITNKSDFFMIDELIVYSSSSLDLTNIDGNTLLIAACSRANKYEIIEHLLQKGADPNVFNEKKTTTPLITACVHRVDEIAKLLLNYDADPNLRNLNNYNAFYYLLYPTLISTLLQDYDNRINDILNEINKLKIQNKLLQEEISKFSVTHYNETQPSFDPPVEERKSEELENRIRKNLKNKEIIDYDERKSEELEDRITFLKWRNPWRTI